MFSRLSSLFIASILFWSIPSSAEMHSLRLANPGEWIHIQLTPNEGDERPIYEIWDAVLKANGFEQVAVPTKSGNRSVRHVAYNPKTKARLKYHILFDLAHRFKMQFEEYEAKTGEELFEVKFDTGMHGAASFTFIPPNYCVDGVGHQAFRGLSNAEKQDVMARNHCDATAYLTE